jgi:hypothetical protein
MLTCTHVCPLFPILSNDREIVFREKQVQRLGHKPLLRNPLALVIARSEAEFFQRLPIGRRQVMRFGALVRPRRRNIVPAGCGLRAGRFGSVGVSKRAGAAGAVAGDSAVLIAVARREGLRLMLSSFHAYL